MAPQTTGDPLQQLETLTVKGGYVAAGVGMRNRGYGSITVQGIPTGASIKSAHLFWDILGDWDDPSYGVGNFNGHPIQGSFIGTGGDPCWNNAANFAYQLDVTSLVPGNGSYALTGFASNLTDGRDPWGQEDNTSPLTEGASLVVVYELLGRPQTNVILYDGSTEDDGGTLTQTLQGFTAPGNVSAETTFIGADGQDAPEDDATFNGVAVPAADWNGNDPQAGPRYSSGNLWDTTTVDVSGLIKPGSTSATVTTNGSGDCHVWIAQVLSVSESAPGMITCNDGPGVAHTPESPNPSRNLGTTTAAEGSDGSFWYSVTGASDLGQCHYNEHPIQVSVDISRFYGPTSNGHPKTGNLLFNQNVTLYLNAWDVDADVSPLPEIDTVSVNGVEVPGVFTGWGNSWQPEGISIPANDLNLEGGLDDTTGGKNLIQINIDKSAQSGTGYWAMAVTDVSLFVGPPSPAGRPTVMLPGLGETKDSIGGIEQDFSSEAAVHPIAFKDPKIDTSAGINAHISNTFPEILDWAKQIRDRTPYRTVDLVGHSFGGFDARVFASLHPDLVNKVVTLATPSGGVDPGFLGQFCRPWILFLWGDPCSPEQEDSIYGNVLAMNQKYPDRSDIYYLAAVGLYNDNTCGVPFMDTSGYFDGCIQAWSGLYLVSRNWYPQIQTKRGDTRVEQYAAQYPSLGHSGMRDNGSLSVHDAWCFLFDDKNASCPSTKASATWIQSPVSDNAATSTTPFVASQAGQTRVATAAATGATASTDASPDIIQRALVQVPANSTATVSLAFGGVSSVQVMADVSTDQVSAAFGGTALTYQATPGYGDALFTTLTQPVDGNLTITNASSQTQTVNILSAAVTTRHLALSLSSDTTTVGGSTAVDVSLSEASTNDQVTAELVQADGSSVAVSLARTGTGAWHGSVAPTMSGKASVVAAVTSASPRYADASLDVATGTAAFGAGFSATLTDSDSDGLANSLDGGASVTVSKPGSYTVIASLVDANQNLVTTASTSSQLTAGTSAVPISFDGSAIYADAVSGSYEVYLSLVDNSSGGITEAGPVDVGATDPFDYRTFEHDRVHIAPDSLTATGVDSNADGHFESLRLSGKIAVDTSATCVLHARLETVDGQFVAEVNQPIYLQAGSQQFNAAFDGADIVGSGVAGPYQVVDISMMSQTELLTSTAQVVSAPYLASQFTDIYPPTSWITGLPSQVDSKYVSVTFDTWQQPGGAGVGTVELWERFGHSDGTADAWDKVATAAVSPFEITLGSGLGQYEFTTVAIDRGGNREAPAPDPSTPASASTTLIPAPPLSHAASLAPLTNSTASPVSFTAGEGTVTVDLYEQFTSADQKTVLPWAEVASAPADAGWFNVTLDHGDGSYGFTTVGTNQVGVKEVQRTDPDTGTVLDRVPPTSAITTSVPATTTTKTDISCSGSDDATGLSYVALYYRWVAQPNDPRPDWTSAGTCNPTTAPFDFPAGNGTYEFTSVAHDKAGNEQSQPWTVEGSTVFTRGPESFVQFSQSATKGLNVSGWVYTSYSYELWGHFAPATTGVFDGWRIVDQGQGAGPITVWTSNSPDGIWEYYTIAVSSTGQREPVPSVPDAQIIVDRTPPTSSAKAVVPRTDWGTIRVPFTWDDGNGSGVSSIAIHARYRPTKDSPWSPPDEYLGSCNAHDGSCLVTLPNGEGLYEFWTEAQDSVGNFNMKAATAEARTHLTTGSDPSSLVVGLPAATSASFVDVPYEAEFKSGSGTVSLWQSFEPKGGSFGPWSLVGTSSDGQPIRASTPADGTYQFFTVASDQKSGTVEATPAVGDASIIRDTAPPTSTLDALATYSNGSAFLTYATDTGGGSDVASVQIWSRFKAAGSSTYSTDWQQVAVGSPYNEMVTLSSGDGLYEFCTRAVDTAGNVETKSLTAGASTTLDSQAPSSQAGPLPAVTSSISVPYSANDNLHGSGMSKVKLYYRYLAPGPSTWTDWTLLKTATKSPIAAGVTNGDGTYEFYTLAVDAAGNTEVAPGVADASTVLDTVAPSTTLGQVPAHVQSSPVSVPFGATDNATGTGVVSVELWQRFTPTGGTTPPSYSKLATIASPTGTFSVPVTQSGTYDLYAIAVDAAGNREAVPMTPDATVVRDPVALASTAGPLAPFSNATSIPVPYTVTGTGQGLASVELWQRFGSGTFSKSKTISGTATSGTFTAVSLGSGAGRYEFYAIAVDTAGNRETAPAVGSPDAFTVLDTTAPTSAASSLTTPRAATTVSIAYTASDNTGGSGMASVDLYEHFLASGSSTWTSWVPVATAATSPISVNLSLGDGRYEFYTRALDLANNREAAPSTYDAFTVLDTTGPISAATAIAAGTKTTAVTVPFTASDPVSGVTSVDLYRRWTAPGAIPAGDFTDIATLSGASGTFSVTLGQGIGRYEFYTRGLDTLGNREAAPTSADTFTVYDTTAPTSKASPIASYVNSTSLSIPYTAADNTNGAGLSRVDLYQSYKAPGSSTWSAYAIVGTPATATSGSFGITLSSGAGSYQFYTRATDVAGNVEAVPVAEASTLLDVTAPTSAITALPSTSSGSNISVAYTSSDNANGAGLATTEFWYRFRVSDGATQGPWTSGGTSTAASGSFTLTFGSGAGIYDVLTVAVDGSGNREGGIASPPAAAAVPKSSVRSTSWTASAKVNTDTGAALQDNASFAVGSDGTVYAVWEDSRNGATNTDIYFSSRNPTTGVWAAETKVNTDTGTTTMQRTPSIAIDGSNNLYVVWADDRNTSTGTDIYFAKRTGTTWSANIKVNADTGNAAQSSPRIAVDSAGVAVAVWYDPRSSQVNIYSARLAAGSTTWSTNYNVTAASTAAVKAAPDVAVASDGTAWATWQDNRSGGGDIYVASLGPTATAWSTNIKASDDSTISGLDKSPRIGLTSAGVPMVAWIDGRVTTAGQVRVAKGTTTNTWSASVQVSDTSAKPASGLAFAVKADGGVLVAWDDTRSTSAIWGAQCEAGSGSVSVVRCGPAEGWSDQAGAATRPALIATSTKAYLVWSDATTGGGDIRFRVRNPS
jgi:pimeloyl-ACP methyl ester carboxylesterase